MVSPINYSIGGPDPSQMLLQGLGTGLQINQMQQARAQAEAQAQAQQRMNAELEAASRDPRMIPGLMVRYPQLAEKFKIGLDSMTADQQRGVLSNNTEVASALAAGKPEFAIQTIERRASLLREQGDNRTADELTRMAELAKTDPDAVLSFTLARINGIPGGDKVSEGILKLFEERRKAAKAPAELREAEAGADKAESDADRAAEDAKKARVEAAFAERAQQAALELSAAQRRNLLSQIGERSKRLKLDEERFAAELAEKMGTLPTAKLDDASRKVVADAAINATAQTQGAEQLESLAARVQAAGIGNGAFAWIAEKVKGAGGWQGDVSALRNEYARVRNSLAIKSLPPGPATDKDIELALRGFPSEYADGAQIAGFLRGMAKMQRIDAEVSNARAEWVTAFRSQGVARDAATIAGIPVAKGQTFDSLALKINQRAQAAAKAQEPQGQTDSGATYSGWGSTP